jgi:hypothetical protein
MSGFFLYLRVLKSLAVRTPPNPLQYLSSLLTSPFSFAALAPASSPLRAVLWTGYRAPPLGAWFSVQLSRPSHIPYPPS